MIQAITLLASLAAGHRLVSGEPISIEDLLRAVRSLPSDKPVDDPKKWYRTQKEHWIGWLTEYKGGGPYRPRTGIRRDARFVYNHIVEPKMLVWLVSASGAPSDLVRAALADYAKGQTMQQLSSIIRRHVPWEVLAGALWRRV